MTVLVLGIAIIFMLSYYAYTNAININYKIHKKIDYSEKEYKDDKTFGGIAFGIIVTLIVLLAWH